VSPKTSGALYGALALALGAFAAWMGATGTSAGPVTLTSIGAIYAGRASYRRFR
jgi:hypothetical protein